MYSGTWLLRRPENNFRPESCGDTNHPSLAFMYYYAMLMGVEGETIRHRFSPEGEKFVIPKADAPGVTAIEIEVNKNKLMNKYYRLDFYSEFEEERDAKLEKEREEKIMNQSSDRLPDDSQITNPRPVINQDIEGVKELKETLNAVIPENPTRWWWDCSLNPTPVQSDDDEDSVNGDLVSKECVSEDGEDDSEDDDDDGDAGGGSEDGGEGEGDEAVSVTAEDDRAGLEEDVYKPSPAKLMRLRKGEKKRQDKTSAGRRYRLDGWIAATKDHPAYMFEYNECNFRYRILSILLVVKHLSCQRCHILFIKSWIERIPEVMVSVFPVNPDYQRRAKQTKTKNTIQC